MTIWLTMSRDERTAAIAAGRLAGLDAARLAKQLKTAATAIEAHAVKFGIALADDSRVSDGQPSAGKHQTQANDGGRHVATSPARATQPAPRVAARRASAAPDRFEWTEERVASLRRMAQEGLSYGAIAAQFGGGVSRGAISGKVDRLGIGPGRVPRAERPKHASPRKIRTSAGDYNPQTRVERLRARAEAAAMKPSAPERLRVDLPEPISLAFTLMALPTDGCKWPSDVDDVRDMTFCGAPRFAATPTSAPQPYCEHHCARAYPPRQTRDRVDRRLGVSP